MLDRLELPVARNAASAAILIRRAGRDDLQAVAQLLSDDPVSAGRGDGTSGVDAAAYSDALERITSDPGNELLVVEDTRSTIVATFQLTLIPGMSRRGSSRLLIEGVRVASVARSGGIGSAMMRWVIDEAASTLGASLVQLTSDAARIDAQRFYRRLGFDDSHVGFKILIETSPMSAAP